jgi:hypothetical protein
MMTVSRRVLLPFLAPPLAPPVFSVLAPNPVQTVKLHPFCRLPLCLPEQLGMVYPESRREL